MEYFERSYACACARAAKPRVTARRIVIKKITVLIITVITPLKITVIILLKITVITPLKITVVTPLIITKWNVLYEPRRAVIMLERTNQNRRASHNTIIILFAKQNIIIILCIICGAIACIVLFYAHAREGGRGGREPRTWTANVTAWR